MVRDCSNVEANLEGCTCSYPGCSRKGKCCECISYHREQGEIPGCLFPPGAERTYDRSRGFFMNSAG